MAICSQELRAQGKSYPRTCAVHGLSGCPKSVTDKGEVMNVIEVMASEIQSLIKQRDAWRAACRYLYEVIGEGGAKGRPMDLISKGDYGRIIAMIGKADLLEESAAQEGPNSNCNRLEVSWSESSNETTNYS